MARSNKAFRNSAAAAIVAPIAAVLQSQELVDTLNGENEVYDGKLPSDAAIEAAAESVAEQLAASDTQEQPEAATDTSTEKREPRILEDVSQKQPDTQTASDDTKSEDTEKQPEAPAATAAPKLTKKLQVRNLIAATPASIATIATHMGISNIAAQSLIGDLKRDKVQVVSKKVDKVTLYTVAA